MKTITVETNFIMEYFHSLGPFQTFALLTILLMVGCYLIEKWG